MSVREIHHYSGFRDRPSTYSDLSVDNTSTRSSNVTSSSTWSASGLHSLVVHPEWMQYPCVSVGERCVLNHRGRHKASFDSFQLGGKGDIGISQSL
jgi:hypothetical protein